MEYAKANVYDVKDTLVFATGNPNKLREIRGMIGDRYLLKGLEDIGCTEEIPETSDTLQGNALLKAQYVKDKFSLDCFAEDTGLEVDALEGDPGVYSARYAGEQKDPERNMDKLLANLRNFPNRKARFRTVVALLLNGEVHYFEGIVNGRIAKERKGNTGFGYDPIFIPKGYDRSFAEMDQSEKNQISHRAIATRKLQAFLQQR